MAEKQQKYSILIDFLIQQNIKNKATIERQKKQITKLKESVSSFNEQIIKQIRNLYKSKVGMNKWLAVGLSIMFVARDLAAVFMDMLRPVLELTGFFDILKAALIMLLLPAVLPLIKNMMKLLKWISSLSPETKKAIGNFVIWGAVIFTIIKWLSEFSVLATTLGKVLSSAEGYMQFLTGLKAISITLAVIIGLLLIWKSIVDISKTEAGWQKFWKTLGWIAILIAGIIIMVMGGWAPALVAGVILGMGVLMNLWNYFIDHIASSLGDAIVNAFKRAWENIKTFVKDLGSPGGILSRPEGIKKMADGGIVTKPTFAMIGESGPEAVVPLNGSGFGGTGGVNININISGDFTGSGGPNKVGATIQSMLRDELRRLGVR